ncbi:hypothetical protein B0H12DRAFT_1080160 [Mycena haematopus]|nr:hypothetical protein B0H12DRAFT_1080160 [Mycena haematopus]
MRIFEVCLFSIPLENPTCVPNFKPDVDHAHHSASSKTSYYVVPEGWKPGVYTNSKAADEQIEGYSGYIRFKVATYKNALEAWKSHCQRNHGVDCPDAVPTYWGIKNYPVIFNSRAAAIDFATNLRLLAIHLFGSVIEKETKQFVGLPV